MLYNHIGTEESVDNRIYTFVHLRRLSRVVKVRKSLHHRNKNIYMYLPILTIIFIAYNIL